MRADARLYALKFVLASGSQATKQEGPKEAAGDGPNDRNPGVRPVAVALSRNREHRMSDPRSEVSGGIDGIAGRATQSESNAQYQ